MSPEGQPNGSGTSTLDRYSLEQWTNYKTGAQPRPSTAQGLGLPWILQTCG